MERKSNLSTTLKQINEIVIEVKEKIDQMSNFKIKHSQPALVLLQTYLKCAECIKDLTCKLGSLTRSIRDKYMQASLKRQILQQSFISNKLFLRLEGELVELFCENNTSLCWDSVNSDLTDSVESDTQYRGITIDELCKVAQSLQTNICIDLKELDFDFNNQKLCTVVKLTPVFLLSNKEPTIFINLNEFVYTPGVFEAIFLKKLIAAKFKK